VQQEEYYPYQIGIVMPRGEQVYEILIVADDKQGNFLKVLDVMSRHYVNFYHTSTRTDMATGTFLTHAFGDFRKADVTAAQLKSELTRLPIVKKVVVEKKDAMPFGKFLFPLMLASDLRVSLVPVDAFVEREENLLREGSGGKQTLIDMLRPLGLSMSTSLRRFLPWVDRNTFISATEEAIRALGWGIFKFEISGARHQKVKVTIRQPIFSELEGVKQSYTTVGLTAGLLEGITGVRYELEGKPTYSSATKEMKFELVAKPLRY
jgi:hypothetical protein